LASTLVGSPVICPVETFKVVPAGKEPDSIPYVMVEFASESYAFTVVIGE
jgi:hypothetical protein